MPEPITAKTAPAYVLANSMTVSATLPRAKPGAMRRVITAFAAGATALSLIANSALPARADDRSDDMLKALIALGAVGIIAHEIDKKNDRDDRKVRDRGPYGDWDDDGTRQRNRPYDPRWPRASRIPSVCAIEIDRGRGRGHDGTVYSERCLRREGVEARLPRDCALEVRTRGRTERVYSENCLRRAGFRIGGR